jgi:DnaK suppressor protein
MPISKDLLKEFKSRREAAMAGPKPRFDLAMARMRQSVETEAGVELRTRNRYLKLISKIDAAVRRIEEGEYGYCEDTGDEIGLKRLEARPVVTRTTEAQERYERAEKQYSDED